MSKCRPTWKANRCPRTASICLTSAPGIWNACTVAGHRDNSRSADSALAEREREEDDDKEEEEQRQEEAIYAVLRGNADRLFDLTRYMQTCIIRPT